MFSRSRRRSATARREPRLITFLLSLVRVHSPAGLTALSDKNTEKYVFSWHGHSWELGLLGVSVFHELHRKV